MYINRIFEQLLPLQYTFTGILSTFILHWFTMQALSFASDPHVSYSNNQDNFVSKATPLAMKVIDNASAQVAFKAESRTNVTVPKTTQTVGKDGAVEKYLIGSSDSYMKVSRQ